MLQAHPRSSCVTQKKDGLVSKIPERHEGMGYNFFLAELSDKRGTERYLEIGVSKGNVLKDVPARIAVGVDPAFDLDCNVSRGKKVVTLVQATSDEFFKSDDLRGTLGGPPDLTFLDGLHTFEFLLRDFINAEKMGRDTSLIAMHDCLPLDDVMTTRHTDDWATRTPGTKFEGWWTGDVWKIVPILKEHRPDLRIWCVNCPPTGLVLITNLDPTSDVLRKNYFNIVDNYSGIASSIENIEEYYQSIEVIDSATFLREFDHSLYFKM